MSHFDPHWSKAYPVHNLYKFLNFFYFDQDTLSFKNPVL